MYSMFGINEFIHTKDKSKKKRYLMVGLAWAAVIIMVVGYVVASTVGLVSLGMSDIIPMYLYTIVSVFILMFTLFKAGAVLFSMKGYDIIISLPVPKVALVVSRYVKMYISNLLLAGLIMIPGLITYGVMEKPEPLFYIIYVVGMMFAPMLPLTIASVIGAIITAISSRMRRRSIANTILTVIVILLFMLAGMNLPKDGEQLSFDALTTMASSLKEQIGGIYPFAVWFNNAVFGEVTYLAGVILIPAAIFVGFMAVLQKYFLGICTLLSGVSSKNNYKIQELKAHGIVSSMWKREIKHYFSSSIYVANTIIGYILAAVAAVAFYVLGLDKVEEMFGVSNIKSVIEVVLPFVFALIMSVASITSCSISMEGKNIWILQTLPVKSKDVYLSKILVNLTVAAPFYIVSVIMGCLTISGGLVDYICIAVIPACYIVFLAVLGISINLAFPLFNWEDEVHVVKQSTSTMVSMLAGIFSCLIPAALVGVVSWFYSDMVDVIRVVIAALLVIVTIVLYKKNGRKELGRLG